MIQGVPAIGVMTELIQLCALYGVVEEYRPLDEYPAEEFTEVYLVKFQKLTSARFIVCLILIMTPPHLRTVRAIVDVCVSEQPNDAWTRRVSMVVCCMCATFQNMRLWKTPG